MIPDTLKEKLKAEFPYKIELHAHTWPISGCGEASPEELIDIYRNVGFDGIVITNHLTKHTLSELSEDERVEVYCDAFTKAEEYAKQFGIKVYLGIELRFSNENMNDYLIYGADKATVRKTIDYLEGDLKTYRSEVKLDKSILMQAHPFRNGMTLADTELLDGVESYNMHCGHNNAIPHAIRHSKNSGFKFTVGGSDFHHKNRNHEGVIALRTRRLPTDSFDLASLIKSEDYIFELGGDSIILP